MQNDIQNVLARLNRIESSSGKWKRACVALAAVIGIIVFAAAQAPNKSLEVEKLVLKDKDGKVRAVLSHENNLTSLKLFDDKGRPSAELGLDNVGPALGLTGSQGQSVTLSATAASSGIAVTFPNTQIAVALGLTKVGPDFILRDDKGKTQFHKPD